MTAPITPYSDQLGDQEPLHAIRNNIEQIQTLTGEWSVNRFERSYAPGKWSARQVLTHLAQTEFALGTRARMAVVTQSYTAQPWDPDQWIGLDAKLSGRAALEVFLAAARMNLAFFEGLTPDDRAKKLMHPDYGELTVDWILHQMAGHQINHLKQLQKVP
jgi:hypothetical protein